MAETFDVCDAGLKNMAESAKLHADLLGVQFARLKVHPGPDALEETRSLLRLVEQAQHAGLELVYTIRDVLDEVEHAHRARVA